MLAGDYFYVLSGHETIAFCPAMQANIIRALNNYIIDLTEPFGIYLYYRSILKGSVSNYIWLRSGPRRAGKKKGNGS